MDRLVVEKPLLRRSVAFSPFVALVILAVLCMVFYGFLRRSREAAGRGREARLAAEEVISDLKDMETAQRGFVLLGDESYLRPYRHGAEQLRDDSVRLRKLLPAAQLPRYQSMLREIAARVAIIDSTIVLRSAGLTAQATDVIREGRGRVHMDAIRAIVDQVDRDQYADLQAYLRREERAALVLITGFTVGIVLVAGLGVFANSVMLRQSRRQQEWLTEIAHQNELLQNQQVELEAQHNELEAQNEELFALNEELTETTQRAEQANEAKTAFLMSMSHELRTPLNAIGGYTDLIEAGVYGEISDKIRDAAARIHVNQQQLLFIINQILDYTGLRAETHAAALYDVDVREVVHSLDAIVAPLVAEKGLTYRAELPSEPMPARAHPERLRQVLTNLLANAIKFTPSPGTIVVNCTNHAETVQISVTDTGIGMAPELMERVFEPFVQGSVGTTRQTTSGVGLGLAISRELMRSMGGEIAATSVVGSGSTFTLVLQPVSAPPAPRESAASLL